MLLALSRKAKGYHFWNPTKSDGPNSAINTDKSRNLRSRSLDHPNRLRIILYFSRTSKPYISIHLTAFLLPSPLFPPPPPPIPPPPALQFRPMEFDSNRGLYPPWLIPLLSTSFFSPCRTHPEAVKNECNHFCLDCTGAALCSYCLTHHQHHRVVQIRRSSYHDAIRLSEVSKLIDVSSVQSYVINSHRILFLNGRPQARYGKGVTNTCEVCGRSILDSFRFCSLGCKLGGMGTDPRLSFMMNEEGWVARKVMKRLCFEEFEENGSESSNSMSTGPGTPQSISPGTPPIVSYRVSRRKGIPRRAPF